MDANEQTVELVKPDFVLAKKKINRVQYSTKEDEIIMDEAMKYPDNLAFGFAEAAKRLKNRKPTQICSRYYYLVKSKKQDPVMITGSKAGFSSNKISKQKNGVLMRKEPLKPMIMLFKQLLEMDPDMRSKVKTFLETIE